MDNKFLKSRIIKFSLIGIGIIGLIKVLTLIFYMIVLYMLNTGKLSGIDKDVLLKIIEVLDVKAITGITTIVTGVTARYGLREITKNLKGDSNQTQGGIQ